MDGGTLRFVSAFFGSLVGTARPDVPRNAPLRVETELPLPLVVTVRKGGAGVGLEIGAGDVAIDIRTDDADRRQLMLASTSIVAVGELGAVTMDDMVSLALEVTEMRSAFDVVDEDLRGRIENQIEGQTTALLEVMGQTIEEVVGEIELPALAGIRLTNVVVDAGGPDGDFIIIVGSVGN